MTLSIGRAPIDEQRLRASGLLPSEYASIVARLGREPNPLELGMLGAMWSEHCGYKHSRRLLRRLPTTGSRVLQGPGENAGAVDIGDGLAVVLKMESHNHPSAVEPTQGAATGVGGIVRDVFTMGARPIALLNSLRFGDLSERRTRYLLNGVVAGISAYGNCLGIPTVGGEITFDPGYADNPLVNVMCVGVVQVERLTRARATGVGNVLLLVGADTGRDGIQGAAFASNDDPEASHRGVVQVGNPFLEKLLLEACLAAIADGQVLAMQDLGAAGLTSSSVEMAARGGDGVGVEIDVARVPRREAGMTPFEVMLSESQERMLLLVERGREAAVQAHFARWHLHAEVVGHITSDGRIRVFDAEEVVAELPIGLLTDEVPAYTLHAVPPEAPAARTGSHALGSSPHPPALLRGAPPPCAAPTTGVQGAEPPGRVEGAKGRVGGADSPAGWRAPVAHLGEGSPPPSAAVLSRLLGSPNLAARRPVFRQYDSTVQANTVFGPAAAAAAVVRLDGPSHSRKGLALTTDCNPRYTRLDPRRGAQQAVAEAARNLACVGAVPIAVTDCLNFGNPEKGHVAWQLVEAVEGLAEACRALDVPIVSGNVSLYNETAGQPIPPTPAVGMVGLLDDVGRAVRLAFPPGCRLVLLGRQPEQLSAGEYHPDGPFPWLDLAAERQLGDLLRALAARRLIGSAQDVSDGGLAVALAECCFASSGVGVRARRLSEAELFSEDQGRALVTCCDEDVASVLALAAEHHVPAEAIGSTGGDRLVVEGALDAAVDALRAIWEAGLT